MKIKDSYRLVIGIFIFMVFVFGTSYAFFTNVVEEHGKLNIVAGTLDYDLESKDLVNHKITIKKNTKKQIQITISSFNKIDSKYELYYLMNQDSDSIQVGYDITSENPVLGIIHSNERKKVTINIRNESSQDIEITFGIVGGFVDNDLVLKKEKSLNQVVGIYENYEIGEEITLTDGSKWHVLENSDPTMKNITLLSDYNLKPDGSYDTGCGKTINETYQCSIRSFDSTGNNDYDENDSNNIGYFLNKTYLPKIQKILDDSSITVNLPTLEQIEKIENQEYNSGGYYYFRTYFMAFNNKLLVKNKIFCY